MTATALREKLHDFIDTMEDEKIEVIYTIFEGQMTDAFEWWKDDEFVKEMDKRVKDFESGKDKGVSWEEVKLKARLRLSAQHNRVDHRADKNKKMELMKQAASDPLFLADMKEISEDFKAAN